MTVSIVIPSFNRRQWLARTIPSYRAVRGIHEIIIVDDGSQDGTVEFVHEAALDDPRIRLVRHEQNKGLPAARNSGIDAADSEFVCFGEDDVIFETDYVEVLLRHLEEQAADVIAGPCPLIDGYESRRDDLRRYVQASSKRLPWTLGYARAVPTESDLEWPFLGACALIRRTAAAELRYDEGLVGNFFREETDFYLRALSAGYRLVYCPHTACYHFRFDRSADSGGCSGGRSRARTLWFSIINNWRFVRRHRHTLSRFSLPGPLVLQAAFVARRGWDAAAFMARRFL